MTPVVKILVKYNWSSASRSSKFSSPLPNSQRPDMLKARWRILACKNAWVTSCQGMNPAWSGHRAKTLTVGATSNSSRNPTMVVRTRVCR